MTINDRLKVVRTNLGLSQQKFADKLGMSCNFINLCENEKRELSEPRMAQNRRGRDV